MKRKKLLSIGALSLAIACVSTGVFAADGPLSNTQKAIVQGLVKTYYAGESAINNLSINKNTKIKDIVNEDSESYKKIEEKLNSNDEGSILVNSINNGAGIDDILNDSLIYASLSKDNFDSYKEMVGDVTEQLIEIASTTDSAERAAKEEEAAKIIDPSYGTITFGKNSDGNTTVSVEKDGQVILQLDTANAKKVMDVFNSFNKYEELTAYMKDLGIHEE